MKTYSLATALADFPTFMRLYGSRVVLGVLIVGLASLLIYNYTNGKSAQENLAREALSTAQMDLASARSEFGDLGELFQMIQQRPMLDARQREFVSNQIERVAEKMRANASDAQKLLSDAVNSNDPAVKADAEVQRGDANLLLAGIPSLPGSTTRPSLNGERSKDDLLKSAEDSYNQVLSPPLNANAEAVRNARFGLATIAENRKDWDKAKQLYQQIIDDASTPPLFKTQARGHQDELAEIQKPLLAGTQRPIGQLPDWGSFPAFSQPTSMPSTMPAMSSSLPASTQPAATQPASSQP